MKAFYAWKIKSKQQIYHAMNESQQHILKPSFKENTQKGTNQKEIFLNNATF